MEKEKVFAVVMAGGKGERFWPQSRMSHPKQLLRLIGNLTLIEQTVDRLAPMVDHENIIVITNQDYVAPMQSLLSDLPKENIIGEPMGRDTAPCVALAVAMIRAKGGDDAVMMLLPADHVIRNVDSMLEVLSDSVGVADEGKVVTIGVDPTYPSAGYGYIHCGDELSYSYSTKFYEGKGFKEKPSMEVAEEFLKAGCYKWNSGMFIWSIKTIYSAFEKHAPHLKDTVDQLQKVSGSPDFYKVLENVYEGLERISIDYAVMEKIDNVAVAQCSFDWDDVGSWTALRNQIRPEQNNNVVRGLHESIGAKDCIVVSDPKHLIATVDVKDLIIVHTDDATLVCNAKSAQKIKELVHQIASKPELSRFL